MHCLGLIRGLDSTWGQKSVKEAWQLRRKRDWPETGSSRQWEVEMTKEVEEGSGSWGPVVTVLYRGWGT